jgi:hypothetical protein
METKIEHVRLLLYGLTFTSILSLQTSTIVTSCNTHETGTKQPDKEQEKSQITMQVEVYPACLNAGGLP